MKIEFIFWTSIAAALGIVFVVVYMLYSAATTPHPKEREQHVLELDCGDWKRYFWKPVSSMGYTYRSDGKRVSDLPRCVQTRVGTVKQIGDLPEGYEQ